MARKCLETTPGRLRLETFLSEHATDSLTLEIGTEDSAYRDWFPNRVGINIWANPHCDVQADAYCLPFPDDSFEVALCTEVLEHLHTPAEALVEIGRVLKPGGKLLLTTPFAYPIHYAPTDYYRYTRFGLEHLLRDWEVKSVSETTTGGAMLATYFHHWLFKKKGLSWKLPKLIWLGCWSLMIKSYQNGSPATANGNSYMPSGYMAVAIKHATNGRPA